MKSRLSLRLSVVAATLSALTACGGGDNAEQILNNPDQLALLVSAYNTGLSSLNTVSGLKSETLIDLFDDAYLDSGETKQNIRDALALEAAGLTAGGTTSSFPKVSVANAKLVNCDTGTSICTLTADVTNSDMDTTTVPLTVQVRLNNRLRLLGNQQAAT